MNYASTDENYINFARYEIHSLFTWSVEKEIVCFKGKSLLFSLLKRFKILSNAKQSKEILRK